MTAKKILMVHDYPPIEGGGLEVNTFLLSKYLTQEGFRPTIATSRFASETYIQAPVTEKDGVTISHLRDLTGLEDLIKSNDIVHIHLTFSLRPAAMAAMEICQKLNKNDFVTLHTNLSHLSFSALTKLSFLEKEQMLKRLRDFLKSDLCTLIAPSPTIKDSLIQLGVAKDTILIRYGIELSKIEGFDNGTFAPCDLLTIGEVSLMKGLNYLIDALKILKDENFVVKLRIVGKGQDLELLKRQVEIFSLSKSVEFFGYVPHDEIFGMINSCKILVQPSLTEVCPIVVLEALALRRLVIGSDQSGLAETLGQGKYGLLFQMGNAFDLAQKIKLGLLDKKLNDQIVQETRKRYVVNNFSIERQVNTLKKVYQEVLTHKFMNLVK